MLKNENISSKHNSCYSNNTLPISKRSKLYLNKLIECNNTYIKTLMKYSNQSKEKNKQITQQDLIVIDDLLKENIAYLKSLSKNALYKIEFQNLFNVCNKILSCLQRFSYQKEIDVYEKVQRVNIYEMYIKMLLITNNENAFHKARMLINELIEIVSYSDVKKYIMFLTKEKFMLFKAICLFYCKEIIHAKNIAIDLLKKLEKNNCISKCIKEDLKRINLMSQVIEFIAEIYDLEHDKQHALDCYKKLYYLNMGKFGEKHYKTKHFLKMKDKYEHDLIKVINNNKKQYLSNYNNNNNNNLNYYYDDYYNYINPNKSCDCIYSKNYHIKEHNVQMNQLYPYKLHKGQTETFSFKIPLTKSHEPMTISIYKLKHITTTTNVIEANHNSRYKTTKSPYLYKYNNNPHKQQFNTSYDDTYTYSNNLFIKTLYFDKAILFKHLQPIPNNYILYTDEVLNIILKQIHVCNNNIYLNTELLTNSLIKY